MLSRAARKSQFADFYGATYSTVTSELLALTGDLDQARVVTSLQQEGGSADVVRALAEFAVETTWPGAANSVRYRSIGFRGIHLRPRPAAALVLADRNVSRVWRGMRRYRKQRRLREVGSIPDERLWRSSLAGIS